MKERMGVFEIYYLFFLGGGLKMCGCFGKLR